MTDIRTFLNPENWLSRDNGPRYVQLRRRLQSGIDSGQLPPDSPLPPERDIATLTNLSRVTVRKAIQALAAEGKIVQRQGSGSFVAPRVQKVEQSLSRLTSFTEDMARRGMASHSQWLERGTFMPSPEEVVALGLGADHSVARLSRLRMADDQPMAVERASLPVDLLPDPEMVVRSLYEALEKLGNRPVRAVQRISAINMSAHDAELLHEKPGSAGLRIERTSYLPGGRVVEFTRSIYRGDAYDFVAELRLKNAPQSKGAHI